MMNRKLVTSGLHRLLSRSPVIFALVCAVVLASFSFFNSNKFQNHYGVLRVTGSQGLRQIYEPETFRLSSKQPETKRITELSGPSGDSVKSLKALVRDAVDRGLVVIVNASDADAAHVLADHSQGARLDISGALDGPTGDILVEVMQELRNMEEMADEVAELKRKLKLYKKGHGCADDISNTNGSFAPRQGGHGFRPSGRALYPLMIFSTFRYAHDEFTAVGIGAPSLLPKSFFEEQENSCTWVEWDSTNASEVPSPLTTNARVQRGRKRTTLIKDGESFYSVVVIRCQFADPAGSNSYGGHLFVNTTKDDHYVLLTEPPESVDKIQFEGPLQHRFAFCTPPIWRPLPAKILKQWLLYHHHLLGFERIHYFFYTGIPLDDATLQVLQPLLDQNMLTIVDLASEMALVGGESEYPTTLLARNDCVHRARFFADWALLWDFNEFLHVLPPTQLQTLITSKLEYPYLAFGNQQWSSTYCSLENMTLETVDPWATDRMIFRLALPNCHNDRNTSWECVGGGGNRKFIVNPRKVFAVHHNYVMDPSWGGADISVAEVRLNVWTGNILSTTDPTCTIVKNPDDITPSMPVDGYWYKDTSFAAATRDARNASFSSSRFDHRSSKHLKHRQTAQNLTTVEVR
ncbi:hypothetical protein M758_5G114100 [Ceratodon purpureus]|nr:hypothetical protein M758_5G114100 [Ceratodon purpureus]